MAIQLPELNPIKKVVAAHKPKSISEVEAFAHKKWAKFPQERCQKLGLPMYTLLPFQPA